MNGASSHLRTHSEKSGVSVWNESVLLLRQRLKRGHPSDIYTFPLLVAPIRGSPTCGDPHRMLGPNRPAVMDAVPTTQPIHYSRRPRTMIALRRVSM
jgi:hypothetical protein